MSSKYKILSILAPLVLLLDQITKFLVLRMIQIGEVIPVIPGYFDLVHVRNRGAAFGILHDLGDAIRTPFFYIVTLVAISVLFYVFYTLEARKHFFAYPLSLIVGGVLGNVIDRLRFGNVVDFISLHIHDKILWGIQLEWPAFNVADSAITVSMVLIFAKMIRDK